MITNETIWGRKQTGVVPKNNVRPNDQKQPPQPRKTRSDKKKDIKVRLSHTDKKILKLAAMKHGISLTAFNSLLVKQELTRNKQYPNYDYDNNGVFVHVLLSQEDFSIIQTMAVELDLSFRRVAHRILMDYITRASGGPVISDWRENK